MFTGHRRHPRPVLTEHLRSAESRLKNTLKLIDIYRPYLYLCICGVTQWRRLLSCCCVSGCSLVGPQTPGNWPPPALPSSGTGTNLKAGTPVQSKSGGTDPARSTVNNFFWSCPSTFLALKAQLVVLASAFVVVNTVWSVSCLLFFYTHSAPCAQPFICKSGGHVPPCPMESTPLPPSRLASWHGTCDAAST